MKMNVLVVCMLIAFFVVKVQAMEECAAPVRAMICDDEFESAMRDELKMMCM